MMEMWNQPTLFAQAVTLSCIIVLEISYVSIHKTSITLRFIQYNPANRSTKCAFGLAGQRYKKLLSPERAKNHTIIAEKYVKVSG